ncbi:cell surface protein [Halobacteria archaeon AArc-dxtr1]|nr:cell surface protein [Halobacteria archaeon AArc-dxtr1]
MPTTRTRRAFLGGAAGAGALALAGCVSDLSGDDDAYEIWALDQGMDNIHIYEPNGDDEFENVETLDLNDLEGVPDSGVVPHMIDYSSDYEYAAIACTAGARTLVFRTEDHELVGNIETGAGSHMAAFSPDDDYIHVDVIGEGEIARVEADLDDEEFEQVDSIDVLEDETVQDAGIEAGSPICHQWDGNGRTLHTLGPSYHDGALVIVDHDEFTVDRAYSGDELPTNCGTMPHPDEDKFYLTAGLPTPTDDGEPTGEDGVGAYYVYDTDADEVVVDGESTEGIDAHGFWFTPDGEELWVLNRETNDGVIVDPETDEVIEEIDAYGENQSDENADRDAPDIMWASPDGEYMFVSLRGPEPVSGDPHAATGVTPGFSVLDIESREIVATIEPDPIDDYDADEIEDEDVSSPDFHGIGVCVVGDYESEIPNSPPF